MVDSGN